MGLRIKDPMAKRGLETHKKDLNTTDSSIEHASCSNNNYNGVAGIVPIPNPLRREKL
jgi:hypothetical protein